MGGLEFPSSRARWKQTRIQAVDDHKDEGPGVPDLREKAEGTGLVLAAKIRWKHVLSTVKHYFKSS